MGKQSEKSLADQLKSFVAPFRYDGSGEFHLKSHKTSEKGGLDKEKGEKIIEANRKRLSDFQEKLYAENSWSLLLIFQGMDAAGKDSAIKSVFDGVDPQGCEVTAFKQPSTKELDHDFLWRAAIALPERGRIGIFNRSHYEECLVVRVHPEILAKQKLPPRLVTKDIWRERFEDISAFERHLARNGTVILKFFLNVSKEEQRERFLARLEEPGKNWKFNMGDIAERALWAKYQAAYQDMIRHTSTKHAPWHVVPADHKWFARVVIGSTIVSALDRLDLQFPEGRQDRAQRVQAGAPGAAGRGQEGRSEKRKIAVGWVEPTGTRMRAPLALPILRIPKKPDPEKRTRVGRKHMKFIPCLSAIVVGAFAAISSAQAQDYPSRIVRIVVPQTAGGGTDTFARAIGQKLGERWGQTVVIENKAGAGGVVGTDFVAKSAPDGYTLLVTYEGSQAINQSLYEKLPFDSLKDFEPIATIAVTPFLLIVGPNVEAKSLKEFIAYRQGQSRQDDLRLGRQRLGQPLAGRDAEDRADIQAGARALQGSPAGDRRRHWRPYRCRLCQCSLGDL